MDKLALVTIHSAVSAGGALDVTYEAQAVPLSVNGSGAWEVVLLVLECLFVLGLLWNGMEEGREMAYAKKTTGTVLSYFQSAWNFVDILSMAMQWTGVALW